MGDRRVLARLWSWRRWPVRWWLALATAVIAGGTLLVLGALLLVLLEGSLQRQLAGYLRDQATPVLERELGTPPPSVGRKPSGRPDRRGAGQATFDPEALERLRDLAPVLIRELAGRDIGVVVYDLPTGSSWQARRVGGSKGGRSRRPRPWSGRPAAPKPSESCARGRDARWCCCCRSSARTARRLVSSN